MGDHDQGGAGLAAEFQQQAGQRLGIAFVERTGRLVVVHEASSTGGLGAEVAAQVSERCFFSLESPVLRVTGYDVPYPASRLEEHFLPDLDRILDAVDRALAC